MKEPFSAPQNTLLLSHGRRTARAVVLLHGLTATPEQLSDLGRMFFERGDNVLIPCMPYHGLPDRMTRALINLTEAGLYTFAANAVEAAQGLGDSVNVLGFSTGGALTAWLAIRYPLLHATAVAPIFGIAFLPAFAHSPVLRIMRRFPNVYLWWDPICRSRSPFLADVGYPGFPLRALHAVMQMGWNVYRQAQKALPKAQSVTFVLNQREPAVNNRMARKVAVSWQCSVANNVKVNLLERSLRLPHDFFMPVCENTEAACSRLVQWMQE